MMNVRQLFTCLLWLAVLPAIAISQTFQDMSLLGRWSNGPCRAVAAEDGLFAVGNGTALEFLSVAADGTSTTLGKVAVAAQVLDVALADTLAYAACGHGGLQVVSIADPTAPRVIGVWSGGHSVNAVVSGGRYVFVAEDSTDLRVLDLQDPTAPASVYGLTSFARRTAIAMAGDHVYVGDNGGDLTVYDVADARHPAFTHWYGDSGDVYDIHVFGGYAYMAQGALGLLVVDVHDPGAIYDVGRLSIPAGWAFGVDVADGMAYVAAAGGGLRVIDTADFAAMVEVGSVTTGGYAGDVAVSDGLALMADSWPGVRVIDIAVPAAPALLGTAAARAEASRIAFEGGVMAVVDREVGLRLLTDGTDGEPVELSSVALPRACDVALADGLALVCRERDGLTLLDVATPTAPDSLTTIDTEGLARAVVLHRGFAWLADGDGGLRVYDLAAPATPTEVGHLQVGSDVFALAPYGDLMVMLDRSDGLMVIDATTPAAPMPLGLLDLPGDPASLAVANGYAYVAAGIEGVLVISLDDPSDPTAETGVLQPGAVHITIDGGYAAVSAGDRGVRLLDLRDPAMPVEDAWYVTDTASAVVYRDRRVLLADGVGGVLVLSNDVAVPLELHGLVAARRDGGVLLRWNRGGTDALLSVERNDPGRGTVVLGRTSGSTWFDSDSPPGEPTYLLRDAARPGAVLASVTVVAAGAAVATFDAPSPNPANPSCTFRFALVGPARVAVEIHDLRGRLVRRLDCGDLPAGPHTLRWDGRDGRGGEAASGTYLARLRAGDLVLSRPLLLVR